MINHEGTPRGTASGLTYTSGQRKKHRKIFVQKPFATHDHRVHRGDETEHTLVFTAHTEHSQ